MTRPEAPGRAAGPLGAAAVAGAAALWALLGLWSRGLADRGVDPVTVAWWRAAGGGACFAVHAAAVRAPWRVPPVDRLAFGAFVVVGVSIFYLSVPQAVAAGGVTVAFVLLYTAPLWVVVARALADRARPPVRSVVLVVAGVVGTALVVVGGGSGVHVTGPAVAWGLVSGTSYASYYVVGRRLFARCGPITVYALAMPIGAIPLGVAAGGELPHGTAWWWAAGLVVVSTYVPYQLLAHGLRHVEPTRAVVIATLEPVLAAVIGWVAYAERLSSLALSGAVVVLAAATAASMTRT